MKKKFLLLAMLFPLTAAAQPVLDDAYYNKLRTACRSSSTSWFDDVDNCCQTSVDTMQTHKAFQLDPALTVECPEGYAKNMLKCASTYQWCEPTEAKQEPKAKTK